MPECQPEVSWMRQARAHHWKVDPLGGVFGPSSSMLPQLPGDSHVTFFLTSAATKSCLVSCSSRSSSSRLLHDGMDFAPDYDLFWFAPSFTCNSARNSGATAFSDIKYSPGLCMNIALPVCQVGHAALVPARNIGALSHFTACLDSPESNKLQKSCSRECLWCTVADDSYPKKLVVKHTYTWMHIFLHRCTMMHTYPYVHLQSGRWTGRRLDRQAGEQVDGQLSKQTVRQIKRVRLAGCWILILSVNLL